LESGITLQKVTLPSPTRLKIVRIFILFSPTIATNPQYSASLVRDKPSFPFLLCYDFAAENLSSQFARGLRGLVGFEMPCKLLEKRIQSSRYPPIRGTVVRNLPKAASFPKKPFTGKVFLFLSFSVQNLKICKTPG